MKRILSFVTLLTIKLLAKTFYRFKIGWPKEGQVEWDRIRCIIFLNHTSLYELLYVGFLPVKFLWMLSARMAAPGADKTLNRPFVGTIFKLFSPGMVSITRKRDDSWKQFLESIRPDSIVLIAAEGRMKRRNGLDLQGKKMTVKPGVTDILAGLDKGQLVLAYSGGLHHVQAPGEGWPKVFKTIRMNLEVFEIPEYKATFNAEPGSQTWKKLVLDDLQNRLETKPPVIEPGDR